MRIFVDPGSYGNDNLGDFAMLEVSLRRLRRLWPDAIIGVHSVAPERLLAIDPALEIVDPIGSAGFCWETRLVGDAPVHAPGAVALDLGRRLRRRWPRLAAGVGEAFLQAKALGLGRVAKYVAAVEKADLVLLSGAGSLNDAFRRTAFRRLETLELGTSSGATTALFSQGIGPIHDAVLRRRAAEVLSHVDFVGLREGVAGPPLLRALGVPPARWAVTGDDAIAAGFAARPGARGGAIGVSLRVAPYSGVGPELVDAVGCTVREAARRHGAALVPVPIAFASAGDDLPVARKLIGTEVPRLEGSRSWNAAELLRTVGECRVVVAGSYHAAVFALSMGVPAVTIAASEYYTDKFQGLAGQFGDDCSVVLADPPDFAGRLAGAVDRAWASAEESRDRLLEAAERQIALSEAAYERLFELVRERQRVRASR